MVLPSVHPNIKPPPRLKQTEPPQKFQQAHVKEAVPVQTVIKQL